nr:MAG TPA: hypothetical protein [Caudoviricetes sp.]DAU59348.1 MAG TPA: hypothetical protein [Crassvirales sp.]
MSLLLYLLLFLLISRLLLIGILLNRFFLNYRFRIFWHSIYNTIYKIYS